MKRIFFAHLILFPLFWGSKATCQLMASELEVEYAKLISKKNLQLELTLNINDKRFVGNQNLLPLNDLSMSVSNRIEENFTNADSLNLKSICEVDVDYYDFYLSTTKNLFFKAFVKWHIERGNYLKQDIVGQVSLDTLIGKKSLRNIDIPSVTRAMNHKIASRIIQGVLQEVKKQKIEMYKIVAFAKYLIPPQTNLDNNSLAELAALQGIAQSSAETLGFAISNETKIVDFGDVTDVVSRKFNGEVISYEILREFDRKSKDGYFCTIVSFIIKSKSKI
jgi:hypothetical protein